jgi:6-phosphogluconolactonase
MSQKANFAGATAALAAIAATAMGSTAIAATVYTETNAAAGNDVQIYRTATDGTLALAGAVATGGLGTDGGLGNQGAIAMPHNGRWLFAVNAGSSEISSFAITSSGLTLIDKVSSGGTQPVSLTVHDDLLYVLNAGGAGNITGFIVQDNGRLRAIANSTRSLSSSTAGAAQVEFNRDGDVLVVTEKATNRISLYRLDGRTANGPSVFASNGKTPFGFAFDRHDDLLVSEAFGGAAGASALSSYDIDQEPITLDTISASVPTHQTAACWVVLARHGRYAYVTNTGSGTVTGYRVDRNSALTRLNADGLTGTTGGNPLDAAVDRGGHTLYVLTPKIGEIVVFDVRADGSLALKGSAPGVAGAATGLVAR